MNRVLWLCSWYPHPGDPFEGDFIQRHARAVSAFTPLTVFYTSQAGPEVSVKRECHIEQQTEAVRERIMLFRHRKTGVSEDGNDSRAEFPGPPMLEQISVANERQIRSEVVVRDE